MKAEKLYTKSVNYYSFVYYDSASKKRVRITRSYIQDRFGHDITDLEEAESVIQTLSHEIASRENDQKDRLAWASEAPEFMEMLELFLKTHKKNAPNSYGNTMHYLRYYVCHYFLQIACTPDVEQWGLYFDEFREWLEERATITRTPGQRISYNSKNHCIHALNIFLKFLYRKHLISHMVPCTRFPAYQMRMRTLPRKWRQSMGISSQRDTAKTPSSFDSYSLAACDTAKQRELVCRISTRDSWRM